VGEPVSNKKDHSTHGLRSARRRDTKQLRLPAFIAVGPPRTGTTWLDRVLRDHVGLPEQVKETQFFVWNYSLGVEWYQKFFVGCDPERPVGEIAPTYFDQPAARGRIATLIPDCKIVCSLRDPVERVYSQYKTWHRSGLVKESFDYDKHHKRLGANGSYASNVKAWQEAFGTENVLVQFYKDLVADRQSYLDAVCRFIGVPLIEVRETGWAEERVAAAEELPRSLTLARFGGRLRTWATRHPSLRLAGSMESGKPLWRFFFAGGPKYPRLDPNEEARLRERLKPEVEALENLLGRDLTDWKVGAFSGGQAPSL